MNAHATPPLPTNRSTRPRCNPILQRVFQVHRVSHLRAVHSGPIQVVLVVLTLAAFCSFVLGNSAALAEPPKATEAAPPDPGYPELPLPEGGATKKFNEEECLAPFEIKAAAGSHYLVKLADKASHAPVMTIFVRGDSVIRVDVPLGTYELKYAAGQKWYGYKNLFGPKTACSKADTILNFTRTGNQVSGYSVTLYAVENGNLSTHPIDVSEF